jgi:hypothetical protein
MLDDDCTRLQPRLRKLAGFRQCFVTHKEARWRIRHLILCELLIVQKSLDRKNFNLKYQSEFS